MDGIMAHPKQEFINNERRAVTVEIPIHPNFLKKGEPQNEPQSEPQNEPRYKINEKIIELVKERK